MGGLTFFTCICVPPLAKHTWHRHKCDSNWRYLPHTHRTGGISSLTRIDMAPPLTKCCRHQYKVWSRVAVSVTQRSHGMQAGPVADLLGLAGVKVGGSADGRGVTLDGADPQSTRIVWLRRCSCSKTYSILGFRPMLHLVQKQISFISAESASQHVLSLQALWLVPFDGQPTCTGSRRTSTGCGCAAFCTMWNPPHAVLNTPYPLSPRKCSSTCYVLPSLLMSLAGLVQHADYRPCSCAC